MKRAAGPAVNGQSKKTRLIDSYFAKSTNSSANAGSKPMPQETTVAPTFDKNRWINALTQTQRDLLQLEIDTLDESWLRVLHPELTKPYFLQLKEFLKEEKLAKKTIFPPEVYSWSRLTPLDNVKVVILGQAHGLCFSVRPPTEAPPSLKNIFKALKNDYPDFQIPSTGLLNAWAKQGVLLLNASLTVRAHTPQSHANRGWETFTQKAIEAVANSRVGGVAFLVWGTPAAKRVSNINKSHHLILRSVHPSPLSASRGFFSCGHFRKANEWLHEKYGENGPIDWDALSKEEVA